MDPVTTADIEVEVRVWFDADGTPQNHITVSGDRHDRIKDGDLFDAAFAIVQAVERKIDRPQPKRNSGNGQ